MKIEIISRMATTSIVKLRSYPRALNDSMQDLAHVEVEYHYDKNGDSTPTIDTTRSAFMFYVTDGKMH